MSNIMHGWGRILGHALLAAIFFFVLNYYLLGTGLEASVSWSITLAVIAAGLAYQQSRR